MSRRAWSIPVRELDATSEFAGFSFALYELFGHDTLGPAGPARSFSSEECAAVERQMRAEGRL
jgi:hypothetical protein